jgi:hypothetical protein
MGPCLPTEAHGPGGLAGGWAGVGTGGMGPPGGGGTAPGGGMA